MANLAVALSWLILLSTGAVMLLVKLSRVPEVARRLLVSPACQSSNLFVFACAVCNIGSQPTAAKINRVRNAAVPALSRRRLLTSSFERWVAA